MKNKSNNENRTFKSVKIGDTLKNFNQDFLHKFGKLDYTIFSKWPQIVGKFFEQHSEPIRIVSLPENNNSDKKNYSRILHVNVSPSAAVEFQHYQNKIVEKINSFFGYEAIKGIKIHQKFIQKDQLFNSKQNNNIAKKNMEQNLNSKINNNDLKKSLLNLKLSIKNHK